MNNGSIGVKVLRKILNSTLNGSLVLTGALCFFSPGAPAQGYFQNLNFENIGAPSIAPEGIWLAWKLGAPGWRHALGGDSAFVYHHRPPESHVGQYYFLADSASTSWRPLSGDFSLVMVSGHYNRADATSPWVHAALEQDGLVPSDAKTFRFMATGDFSLSLNSTVIPTQTLGGNWHGADVSAFAGQFVTLALRNEATRLHQPVILDELSFSSVVVPEPSAAAVLLLGAGALLFRRRKA